MFHSDLEIKEGAFLVSDAHYSSSRSELLEFIKAIHSKKLLPTQLIFFGDIFDTLFGGVMLTQERNKEAIRLLNEISLEMEFIYIEGNHDFNLKEIFPNAEVFPISKQPFVSIYEDKEIVMAHGDFGSNIPYKIYTSIIRNFLVLTFLNLLNKVFNDFIIKKLDIYLEKKDDCKELENFEEFTINRVGSKFECDYFIEGHFHQNRSISFENFKYINLAAFACNQRYFIVKSLKDKELLEENIFSKET